MSALVGYASENDLSTNVEVMQEAASHVALGEITQAVRDTKHEDREIKTGDWLGIDADGITVITDSLTEALCELASVIVSDEHELLTVIEGQGASPDSTQALQDWVRTNRPDVEIELHQGGQPLYPYLLGAE